MTETDSFQKNAYHAQLLANRIAKRQRHLKKWAKRSDVTCYRLYDRDIPEIPLAIDFYQFLSKNDNEKNPYVRLFLYKRPYEKEEDEEKTWLFAMASALSQTLDVPVDNVIAKTRCRQRGTDAQYEKDENIPVVCGVVKEHGLFFKVNLSSYLDTGLFLDHRPLRNIVRMESRGKDVLNLFCYTGAFSVHAAAGGANRVDSVDLSNTYLSWAKENFFLNNFSGGEFNFIRSDVKEFLLTTKKTWDIIVLDPPTFSNSKKTKDLLDINRDWLWLVENCLNLLNKGGVLYFSTNSRKLNFDMEKFSDKIYKGCNVKIMDISARTIPEDFRNERIHRCWKFFLEAK